MFSQLRPISVRTGLLRTRCTVRPLRAFPPIRSHATHGHGHGHGHEHGNTHGPLIDRSTREGTQVTLAGLGLNVGLTVAKGAGGIMWHSSSLIAEAVHSLSDLTSDFVTLFSYRKARAPPSRNFPLGYAKLEPLGGVIVSGLLIAAGVGIALNSAELLYTLLTHPSPTSTAHPLPPIALYIMVSSVVLKEAMYRWTLHIANRVDSDVLRANAWHHRLDAASSSVALAAVAGAVYGVPWLDPVGGVLVAGMVVKAGVQSGMPSLMELLDAVAPEWMTKDIEQTLDTYVAKTADIAFLSNLGVRKAGPVAHVDVRLSVSDATTMSVARANEVSAEVEKELKEKMGDASDLIVSVRFDGHSATLPATPAADPAVNAINKR